MRARMQNVCENSSDIETKKDVTFHSCVLAAKWWRREGVYTGRSQVILDSMFQTSKVCPQLRLYSNAVLRFLMNHENFFTIRLY
jgi:hypothetical protein